MPLTDLVNPIRIIIADDHSIFRTCLASYLRTYSQIKIIAEVANGKELINMVEKEVPDVVLTDIQMPIMCGFEAASIINKSFPGVGIVVLSMYDNDETIFKILESGIDGYVLKNSGIEEVCLAIKAAKNKVHYYSNNTISRILQLAGCEKNMSGLSSGFTNKELTVMKMICRQSSNKKIASDLNCTIRSVESARERIQVKTGAKNMVGVVLYAIKNGIFC